jgi:hypothetical protein
VGDDPVTTGFQAEVLADLVGTGRLDQRGTRQVDGVSAGLIGLFAADTDWAHK